MLILGSCLRLHLAEHMRVQCAADLADGIIHVWRSSLSAWGYS